MYRRIRSPKQRFIRTFVSRQHFPAQRKGGGISKGGNPGSPLWLRAGGTPAQTIDLRQHRTEIVRQISSIIFRQIDKIDAGILSYFKEILAKKTKNLPKDGVQSRQAVFVRCCLNTVVK